MLLQIPLYNAECGSVDALFTVQTGEEEGRSFLLLKSYILKLLMTFKLNTWENNVRNPLSAAVGEGERYLVLNLRLSII